MIGCTENQVIIVEDIPYNHVTAFDGLPRKKGIKL